MCVQTAVYNELELKLFIRSITTLSHIFVVLRLGVRHSPLFPLHCRFYVVDGRNLISKSQVWMYINQISVSRFLYEVIDLCGPLPQRIFTNLKKLLKFSSFNEFWNKVTNSRTMIICDILRYSFWQSPRTWQTDRQTDGESDRQTPCPTPIAQFDGIGRATRAYTWHRVAKTKCCKA